VLIDHFLEDAVECDVDALCDGTDIVIAGIMQHIERPDPTPATRLRASAVISATTCCAPYARTREAGHGIDVIGLVIFSSPSSAARSSSSRLNRAPRARALRLEGHCVPLARSHRVSCRRTLKELCRGRGARPGLDTGGTLCEIAVFPWGKFPAWTRVGRR